MWHEKDGVVSHPIIGIVSKEAGYPDPITNPVLALLALVAMGPPQKSR